jgi:hypothetical protein
MTATTARPRALGAAAAVAALLILSACGEAAEGGGVASAEGEANPAAAEDAENTAPLNADAQGLAFAECMRAEGVPMPDPEPGQRGLVEAFQHEEVQDTDQAAIEQAFAACQGLLPQFDQGPDHQRERAEMMLRVAECIRAEGFDVSDDLAELRGRDAVDDGDLRAVLEACRGELGVGQ